MIWTIIKRNSRYLLWFVGTMLMLWSGFVDVLWGKVFFSIGIAMQYFYMGTMNELIVKYGELVNYLKEEVA